MRLLFNQCILYYIHQSVVCLTTGPKPPLKRFLHIVLSRGSSFKWKYPLLSLRSSSSFTRLLPRLLVTYNSPSIFPSITCFRRQFLHKMWPIQLTFLFLISCRIFLCSLTLSNTSSFLTWSVQLSSLSFSSTTFQNFPGISDLLPEESNVTTQWKYLPFRARIGSGRWISSSLIISSNVVRTLQSSTSLNTAVLISP